MNTVEWNDETIEILKTLWAEGRSTSESGRKMGIGKNAVIGKAHRLGLPPRPSPILRSKTAPKPPRPPRVSKTTDIAVADIVEEVIAANQPVVIAEQSAAPDPDPEMIRPEPRVAAKKICDCRWPIDKPDTPQFRFYDANAMTGKPYCAEHMQEAYLSQRERHDERHFVPHIASQRIDVNQQSNMPAMQRSHVYS
jgi:GcrA cell cycle regulator